MDMKRNSKKQAWFIKIRNSYLPCSWQGLTIYFVYLAYLVALPVAWYYQGHDMWRLLTNVLPLAAAAAIVAQFIASKNAR